MKGGGTFPKERGRGRAGREREREREIERKGEEGAGDAKTAKLPPIYPSLFGHWNQTVWQKILDEKSGKLESSFFCQATPEIFLPLNISKSAFLMFFHPCCC